MHAISILGLLVVLLGTISIGILAHELSHAVVLHFLGVPFEIEWFPEGGSSSHLGAGLFGTWASVTPQQIPRTAPVWGVRLSAIAPFGLLIPFVLVIAGILPNPLDAGNAFTVITIGWLGCALPSPQDFSVFWHADHALREHPTREPTNSQGAAGPHSSISSNVFCDGDDTDKTDNQD